MAAKGGDKTGKAPDDLTEMMVAWLKRTWQPHLPLPQMNEMVRAHMRTGASRATLFRHARRALGIYRPDILQKQAVEALAPPPPTHEEVVEAAVERAMPAIPGVGAVVGRGTPVAALDMIRRCIEVAEEVMGHARAQDGRVRNARMLLQASEHLRRALDTAVRMQETLYAQAEVERFHQAVLDVLLEADPALARKVVQKLGREAARFAPAPSR